jgi:hypothetical protein
MADIEFNVTASTAQFMFRRLVLNVFSDGVSNVQVKQSTR